MSPKVFDKIGVHVEGKDIQACHRLKDNDRVIVKFSNRKDSLQILGVKKDRKPLDPTEFGSFLRARKLLQMRVCVPITVVFGVNVKN